ncbi:MAG: hypothetical protein ABSE55_04460 [Terracidiphilus sp.]|jgi:hypothetical protein
MNERENEHMLDPKEVANLVGQIREIAVRQNMQDLMDYPAVFAEYMFREKSSKQILEDAIFRYLLTLSNEQQDAFGREGKAIQELYKTNPDAAKERQTTQLHTVYTWFNETLARRLDEDRLDKDGLFRRAVALILSQERIDESIRSLDPDSEE